MATDLSSDEKTTLTEVAERALIQTPTLPNLGETALKRVHSVIQSSTGRTDLGLERLRDDPVNTLIRFILELNGVTV